MRKFLFFVFAVCFACLPEGVFAQWLPERGMIREANRQYGSGDYSLAETGYRKAVERMKEPAGNAYNTAMFNLTDAIYKQERYEEAEGMFMKLAQDSVSRNAAANYYNAGNAMVSQRKLEEALEAYKNAMRRDPADVEAKFNYAYVKKLLEKNDGQQDQDQDQQQDQNKDQDQQQDKDQNRDDRQQDNGEQPSGLSKEDAEKMLEIEQMNEDKTRENMQEKGEVAVGRSGKNW